jgi:hypothetical protein
LRQSHDELRTGNGTSATMTELIVSMIEAAVSLDRFRDAVHGHAP